MKAIVYTKYGSPDVLRLVKVAKPIPQDNQLLVQIVATTVNRTDCAQLRAKPFIMRFFTGLLKPKRQILGTSFAGEVVDVGKSVSNFQLNDRVFGFDDEGLSSHAEFCVISADKGVAIIPENISFEAAAASIEGEHYAITTLKKLDFKIGKKVLINGATGAIGSATVQLSKYYGAEVTAVCATESIDLVKSLGADKVIDYQKEEFTQNQQIMNTYDYVFDTVGKSSFAQCKSLLKPKGVYISSELGLMAQNIFYSLITPIFRGKIVKFPIPTDIQASVFLIKDLLAQGHYKPLIDKSYPLEKIAEAYRYVETGEKIGNVVIILKT